MVTARQVLVKRLAAGLRILRALLGAAVPLTAVLWWWTTPTSPPLPSDDPQTTVSEPGPPPAARDLAWYAPLWERDLRQPPIPPAPLAAPPGAAPAQTMPRLVATFVEGGVRFAHFTDGNGRAQLKAIDESVGRFRVAAIEPGRVQLADGADAVWLEVPILRDR